MYDTRELFTSHESAASRRAGLVAQPLVFQLLADLLALLGIVAGHLRRDVGVGELDVQVVGERVDGARDAQRVQGLARQQVGRVRIFHQALRQLVQHEVGELGVVLGHVGQAELLGHALAELGHRLGGLEVLGHERVGELRRTAA